MNKNNIWITKEEAIAKKKRLEELEAKVMTDPEHARMFNNIFKKVIEDEHKSKES